MYYPFEADCILAVYKQGSQTSQIRIPQVHQLFIIIITSGYYFFLIFHIRFNHFFPFQSVDIFLHLL